MAVSIQTGPRFYEIGTSDFLHAFFSTVSFHLEPKGWGTRFPALMMELYQGALPQEHIPSAEKELAEIKAGLSNYPPSQVIWDIDNLDAKPPWGSNISPDVKSLANYFGTSNGKDLLEVIASALEFARAKKADVSVVSV
jgi:hypothetical protein